MYNHHSLSSSPLLCHSLFSYIPLPSYTCGYNKESRGLFTLHSSHDAPPTGITYSLQTSYLTLHAANSQSNDDDGTSKRMTKKRQERGCGQRACKAGMRERGRMGKVETKAVALGQWMVRNVWKTGCGPCFVIVLVLFRTSLSICLVFGPSISSYDSPLPLLINNSNSKVFNSSSATARLILLNSIPSTN